MNFKGRAVEPVLDKKRKYEPVTKYMAKDLITFKPEQSIEEAMQILLDKKISGAPVLDDERHIVGMLSEKDCLKIILESAYYNMPPEQGMVRDYMTKLVTSITAEADVLDVADRFLNSNYRRFPVIDKGCLIGQVSRRDILRAAMEIKKTDW